MKAHEFWAIGDYAIVGDLWSAPGRDLAAALAVGGCDVVDVATGTGVTAIAMARNGARSVAGVDVTPSLLAEAARRAEAAGVAVDWIEADFCSVPLPDGSADLVVSTFGLIFAEDPTLALAECRRLVRPGGRIVFTSWSGAGLFGRFRETLGPYLDDETPVPWHETPAGIRSVAGDHASVVEHAFVLEVGSPQEFVSQLERHSAPFVLAAESLGDSWAGARAALIDLFSDREGPAPGPLRREVAYLVTTLAV